MRYSNLNGQALADDMAKGLVNLANMIRKNPQLADEMRITFDRMMVPVSTAADPTAMMAAFVRARHDGHATVSKTETTDSHAMVMLHLSDSVALQVYAQRDLVCERIVVGTEQVTETVPDPEALAKVPTITQTVDREIVEWSCPSILAASAERVRPSQIGNEVRAIEAVTS